MKAADLIKGETYQTFTTPDVGDLFAVRVESVQGGRALVSYLPIEKWIPLQTIRPVA